MPIKFSAYQSFVIEQILFPPSNLYQEDLLLRISAVTFQKIVTRDVKKLKKHFN
jgi:hypothetical protein